MLVTDEQIYAMYRIARTMANQPREEAVIDVANHLHIDEYDVQEAIDRHREAKGWKPIDWEEE